MADEIITRFGALDGRLAGAVRHALEVAVFLPALAPLNEVHARLGAITAITGTLAPPDQPPSHRWALLMTELFGPAVGGRRSPVCPVAGTPNTVTLRHIVFARSHPGTAGDQSVVNDLVAAAGAFVTAEATVLGEVAGHCDLPDDAVSLEAPLLAAGAVGTALARCAAAGTWRHLLEPPDPPRTGGFRLGRLPVLLGAVVSCLVLVAAVLVTSHPTGVPGTATLSTGGGVEQPDLTVSVMATTDIGPLLLAIEEGRFAEAGFTFGIEDLEITDSGAESVARLAAGRVDIAYATYPPFFLARAGGFDVKLISGASSAGPGSCVVVALPGSRVRSAHDLAGARVAVTARDTISELMVSSALAEAGVDHRDVEFVEVPFPRMAGLLADGEIDAAFLTEPYLSAARRDVGAVPLFDTATGATRNLPTAGFGTSAAFVERNPRTVAEFQRILAEATSAATADRSRIEPLLEDFADIDGETVERATLLTFQSALDARRLQRVPDLMRGFGLLDRRVDAAAMIPELFD